MFYFYKTLLFIKKIYDAKSGLEVKISIVISIDTFSLKIHHEDTYTKGLILMDLTKSLNH